MQKGQLTQWIYQIWVVGTITFNAKRSNPYSGVCSRYAVCSRYKARHAHKRLYTVLPKYSKIQVLPGITSCRLVKDNKQAIELNSLLINNMPKDGYEWN